MRAAIITSFFHPRAKKKKKKYTHFFFFLSFFLSFSGYKGLLRSRKGMKLQEEVLWVTQGDREAGGDLVCSSVV